MNHGFFLYLVPAEISRCPIHVQAEKHFAFSICFCYPPPPYLFFGTVCSEARV